MNKITRKSLLNFLCILSLLGSVKTTQSLDTVKIAKQALFTTVIVFTGIYLCNDSFCSQIVKELINNNWTIPAFCLKNLVNPKYISTIPAQNIFQMNVNLLLFAKATHELFKTI